MGVALPQSEDALGALLRSRFHGAVNIRGIRFQILYALLCALDLYRSPDPSMGVRLEGIEDVDLLGFAAEDTYVQVKTSQEPWTWGQLSDPVLGFLQVLRTETAGRFRLVTDFPLKKDLGRLARFTELPDKERRAVQDRFIMLCRQLKQTSKKTKGFVPCTRAEALTLLGRLEVSYLPETEVWLRLRQSVIDAFDLSGQAVDVYLLVLVARFLEWAKARRTVIRDDLDQARLQTREVLSREAAFEAYGRGLVERVAWEHDAQPQDFFEGKGTRPGHVVDGLDVPRPVWLERIDRVIHSGLMCIIRSSSGQGKSTLLYRYAHDRWPSAGVFALRVAQTTEQVALVRQHLQFRAGLGLPLLLLIDGGGWQTPLWPQVAHSCAEVGIRVLVAVRNEDWQRFGEEGMTGFEVLDPALDLEEARQIFAEFRGHGRIHGSVDSADWAYERVGEPHLLMEYVYLITHGRMLEDRLRDQLNQITRHGEDPAKLEILRRTALADSFGVPIQTDQLLQTVTLRDDAQQVLLSLEGEYVKIQHHMLVGLHRVRSEHLVRLLHAGYPEQTHTALKAIEAVPKDAVALFISGAVGNDDVNRELLLSGLAEKSRRGGLTSIVAILKGLFDGGERSFFRINQDVFDEAHALMGPGGSMLLGSSLLPIVKTAAVAQLAQLQPENETLRELVHLADRARQAPRGLDLCRDLLHLVLPNISLVEDGEDVGDVGRILDWSGLCGVLPPVWPSVRDTVLARLETLDLAFEAFCACAQGVFRCDAVAYQNWFVQHQDDITGYLQLHTRALELRITSDALFAAFLLAEGSDTNVNDQVVSRLQQLRSAVPFCQRYQSQGLWFLPFGLMPSHDESRKDMPSTNLHLLSDLEKNRAWTRTVELAYLPDSHYRHQQSWHNVRKHALAFGQVLNKGVQRSLQGKPYDYQAGFEQGLLLERLQASLKDLPDPPPQMLASDRIAFMDAPKRWATHFDNFFRQFLQHVGNPQDDHVRRLIVFNLREVVELLPRLQVAFAQVFERIPDYFSLGALDEQERATYPPLAERLDVWLLHPPSHPISDVPGLLASRQSMAHQETIKRVEEAVSSLADSGVSVVLPSGIFDAHPLRYVAIGFSVSDPSYPQRDLELVLQALAQSESDADMYCLVPLHDGAPFVEGGYVVSSLQLQELRDGTFSTWETLIPRPFPDHALQFLSLPTRQPNIKLELKAQVAALFASVDMLKRKVIALLETGNQNPNRFVHAFVGQELEKAQQQLDGFAGKIPEIKAQWSTSLAVAADHEAGTSMSDLGAILISISEVAQTHDLTNTTAAVMVD